MCVFLGLYSGYEHRRTHGGYRGTATKAIPNKDIMKKQEKEIIGARTYVFIGVKTVGEEEEEERRRRMKNAVTTGGMELEEK